MKVSKAYIMYHEDSVSVEYAKVSAASCDKVGLPWEYYKGYKPTNQKDLWKNFKDTAGVNVPKFKKFLDHILLLFNFEKKYFDKEIFGPLLHVYEYDVDEQISKHASKHCIMYMRQAR